MAETKTCSKCGTERDATQFYNKSSRCKPCKLTEDKVRKHKNHEKWHSFLSKYKGFRCAICGYDREPKALEYHHVHPHEKLFNIATFVWERPFNDKTVEKLKAELNKTILLCACCHRETHYNKSSILYQACQQNH